MRSTILLLLVTVLGRAQPSAEVLRQADEHLRADRFAVAESMLASALKGDPSNVEVRYRLGYSQYRQRKFAEARTNFTAVVKTAPPAHFSRYFLGRIALAENHAREAINWLEPVANSTEAVFDSHSQLAAAYAAAGEPGKAVPVLRTAIAASPWEGALYYRLGQLYRRLGQTELSRESLETATRLNNASRQDVETIMRISQSLSDGTSTEPLASSILRRTGADPNTLVALGVVLGNAGRHAEALEAFERAATRDPRLFQAQFNYGLALLKAGRRLDSLAPLAKAVQLLPQSLEANTTLGLAAVMGQDYPGALTPLERAWRMDPSNPRVGSLLATSYLRTGAASKAVPILRDLTRRDSAPPESMLLLVEALNANDDPDGALEVAEAVRTRFPDLAQAHMAAAQQLARLGRYQEARPAFEQTLRLAPGRPEAILGLADTLQKGGDDAAAVDHYRAALENENTKLAARLGLARSLVVLRKLEEARATLEEGLNRHPSDVTLRLELSRVYARLGQRDLAAEQARIVETIRAAGSRP